MESIHWLAIPRCWKRDNPVLVLSMRIKALARRLAWSGNWPGQNKIDAQARPSRLLAIYPDYAHWY